MEEFKVGEIVYLVTGSPAMTVTDLYLPENKEFYEKRRIICSWFTGTAINAEGFHPLALTKNKPNADTASV